MKTNLIRAALACAALMFTSTAVIAATTPVPGVDVVVHSHPAGIIVMHATSDADGRIALKGLEPGDYELVIDGPSFVAAMDRVSTPPKKSGGLSIGVGGMFGGGSSGHSGSGHPGTPGGASHGSSSSGGGVGVTVPLTGGGNPDTNPMAPGIMVTVNVGGTEFSSTTPYCRDSAARGMQFGFTIPQGGGSVEVSMETYDNEWSKSR